MTHITDVLKEIHAHIARAFRIQGVKWGVTTSDMNQAVLVVENGWPGNRLGTMGLVGFFRRESGW